MSLNATIDVGGKTFPLVYCRSDLMQKADNTGRPSSGVHGGEIWIVIGGTADDTFGSWIADPTKKQDGTITLFKDTKFKEIEFKGAYLTVMFESFIDEEDIGDQARRTSFLYDSGIINHALNLAREVHNRTQMSYVIVCKISAEKIKIDGVPHDNKW
jgi:hypothetical protein